MTIYYLQGDQKYSLSYQQLAAEYDRFCAMPDVEFLLNLPAAIHFACFVGWVKELGVEATISDVGIVHELVHLLHLGTTTETSVAKVREQFASLLKLSR